MKACLIAPIPDLARYVDRSFTTHLLLAHLFELPSYGKIYQQFYEQRAHAGDYLIMDNGAKEEGQGVGLARTLRMAEWVGASEVVLTDVRFRAIDTLRATRRDLDWLLSYEGRQAYYDAGSPSLMIVPQGGSFTAWKSCYHRLKNMVEEAMLDLEAGNGDQPVGKIVIGMAYCYDHMLRQPFGNLVECAYEDYPVHMLGWPRRLQTLTEMANTFPKLRSVDSSKPLMYAKMGTHLGGGMHRGRDVEFFTDSIPSNHAKVARDNIEIFRRCAGDHEALGESLAYAS